MATTGELRDYAYQMALKYDLNPEIFIAQLNQESGFQTGLTSSAGAIGPGQLMPATAAELGVDPNDPYQNIEGAARYMAQQLAYYDGDYVKALAAYNAGAGTVDAVLAGQAELPAETGQYLDAILAGGSVGSGALMPLPGQTSGDGSLLSRARGDTTASVPNSAQIEYNGQGQAYRFDPAVGNFVRAPELDDPSKSATFQNPTDLAQIAAQLRGQDLSYSSNNLDRAQQASQFSQNNQLAKDQFLWQQQNDIAQLDQRNRELATQQAQNARMYSLELQNQQFLENQFAFQSGMALRQESRATQEALFSQQATVAGIQLEMASITQSAKNLQAQLNQEVAIFNAAKEADVSMFNIDQQTKVATFNAQSKGQTDQFNSEMGFNVQRANQENERLRQQQLIDVAEKISNAAANPGDWGKLNALTLALGGGANIGAQDAGLANADLRTADSLMPLEAMLRQRRDIQDSEANPFKFTPLDAPQVAAPPPAVFNPASPSQVPMPDFSGVNVPTPNVTPFDPASIPTQGKTVSPMNFDSTKQGFIATGTTNDAANGQQLINTGTGQPLTAEERAQIPDVALQLMIDSGTIKRMAGGGMFNQGQVTPFGDSSVRQTAQNLYTGGGNATQSNVQTTGEGMGPFGAVSQGTQPNGAQLPANVQSMYARIAQMFPFLNMSGGGQPFINRQGAGQWMQQRGQMQAPFGMPPGNANAQPFPFANEGGMMDGMFVAGDDDDGDEESPEIIIPIGPGQAIVINAKQTKKVLKNGQKAGKSPKKMATGGIFDDSQLGKSAFEDLLPDQDRQMASDFLTNATRRASLRAGYNPNALPTPVFFSSPGTPFFQQQLGASLSALGRGIPMQYFLEQAQRQAPAGYSEGVIGRTR